jgi:hypothetical protein
MPILTKNETPSKGAKAEFQLDKAALAAVTSVAADSYFSDSSNWKSVDMIFKSNPGNQRRTVKFDASQAAPISNFFASARARDVFEIEKIVINDLDGGEFRVNRSELTTSEFDINMGGPLPYQTLDFTQGVLPANTQLTSGALPILSNASAKFLESSTLMVTQSVFTSYSNYKVRIYIESANKTSGSPILYLQNLYQYGTNVIFEIPPFFYGAYDPNKDLQLNAGGYVEFTFQSGFFWGQNQPQNFFNIIVQNLTPGAGQIEITKIEIFEV